MSLFELCDVLLAPCARIRPWSQRMCATIMVTEWACNGNIHTYIHTYMFLNKAKKTPKLNNKTTLNKANVFLALNPDLPRWGWPKPLFKNDSWKLSKMMDALSIQNLYLNLSKINSKSTHQGYPPWGALAPIRVWPWIKLLSFPLPLIKKWILNQY